MNKSIDNLTERWIKEWSNTSTRWDSNPRTSAIEFNKNTKECSEPSLEQDIAEKIFANHIEKYRKLLSSYKPKISAVVDEPDFHPASFLQIGLERSAAICRISKYFSDKDLKVALELLKEKIERQAQKFQEIENHPCCNPPYELKIIFSIPNSVFDEIFQTIENKLTFLESLNILETKVDKLMVANPLPIGTGFLVGGSHLLTNHHVIQSQNEAKQCIAQFGYVEDDSGVNRVLNYDLNPELLFISNPELDYSLVQLKPTLSLQPAGYKFGWINLIELNNCINPRLELKEIKRIIEYFKTKYSYTDKQLNFYGLTENREIIPGDKVVIIQHPRGRTKEIVLQNNEVIKLSIDNLDYKADTDYGSSGSPVFNMNWELVALTKKVVPNLSQFSNKSTGKNQNLSPKWMASQGTNICRIIQDLKAKSFSNSKLQSFLEDFVITSEQLNYPPLPSALQFDGNSSYVDFGAHEILHITEEVTFEAWVQRNPVPQKEIIVDGVGAYSLSWETGFLWIHTLGKRYLVGSRPNVLNDGLWHHVSFTVDKHKKITIYIDGEIVGQEQQNKVYIQRCSPNIKPISLYLGGIPTNFNNSNVNYFNGSITEVRLWGIVRTHQQIKNNMYRRLNSDDRKGLKGYWQFEEGQRSKVYNFAKSIPSSYPSIEDFAWHPLFGLQLNGWRDYIDCGNYETLKIENEVTVEAWIQEDVREGIIVNRGGSWYEPGYSLWKWNGKIRAEISDGNIVALADADPPINDKNYHSWYHIAFTWNLDSKKIKIYINGTERKIQQQIWQTIGGKSQCIADDALCEISIGQPRVNLNIGRAQNFGYYFNGSIAEVRLWKVARTEEQIKANMSRKLEVEKARGEGLIGYWRLNEEEDNKARNWVSEGKDGVVYGGKWLKPYNLLAANQGAYGLAFGIKRLRASQYPALPLPFGLQFQEESDHVDCGSGENLNTPTAITVEAWFKHKFGNCLIVSQHGILEKNGRRPVKGYSLSWHEGKIRVFLSDGVSKGVIVYSKENAPSDCLWHHIAFTWDKTSQEIAIYIDGRQQDSIVKGKSRAILFQGQYKNIGLFEGYISELTANILIGVREENKSYFNVAIAEVRLWNVVRTQDEIKANMSQRLDIEDAKIKGLIGYWRLDDGGEGNQQARNLISDNNHGTIHGATWFPAPPPSRNFSA